MSAREDSAFPPSGSDRVAPPLLAPAALPTKKNAAAGASAAPSGLDRAQLARLDARRKKKGVVYMSRVPPNMVRKGEQARGGERRRGRTRILSLFQAGGGGPPTSPQSPLTLHTPLFTRTHTQRPPKVRHLLSQYAPIGRIYLAAEDPAATKARRKGTSAGGSGVGAARPRPTGRRSKRFTEGWVEFECKGDARATAAALNGQPVGGPPRASHRHDLWTLRYLPGFRWEHLTEEVAYQNAVREQRLAVEAGAAARERDFYAGRVGAARAVEAQAARRAKRGEAAAAAAAGGEGGGGGGAAPAPVPPPKPQPVRRTFSQKPAVEAKGRVCGGGGGGLSRASLALLAGRKG